MVGRQSITIMIQMCVLLYQALNLGDSSFCGSEIYSLSPVSRKKTGTSREVGAES